MKDLADQPTRVNGDEAKRIKREALGIADRKKHHGRAATAMKGRAKAPDTQQRVYRYRFYPTPSQAEQLEKTFGACRWVYNEGLELRVGAWERHRVSVGFAESCRALTGWRQSSETSWLREVSSTVLQQSLRHLDGAFTRFFKQLAKHPQRKTKHRSRDSATYVRTGFRWAENPELPGTGLVTLAMQTVPLDVRWSRPLPAGAEPVRVSVTRDRAGRYFLAVLVEERIEPLPAAFVPGERAPKAVGIDLGLAALVTLDDGTKVDHPRLLKKYERELARLQRGLHRKTKGSKNREKARQRIARLYALISDVRRDTLDQLTTRLVRENQVLVVEDLAIMNLLRPAVGKGRRRKARLSRSIIDAAWGELLRQLRYKCVWYGRTLVIVDRFFPSTRRCSGCHAKGPSLDVSVREWTCAECGAVHDRDVNAARNLQEEGMRLYWLVASALPPGRRPPSVIKASEPADVLLAA
ncbi:transposase [Streptomyces sp. A0642]|uniref:RNA-guided endonuclease InsQ/TnpB family protein n=1 Tax=Streptomyces sp. A0642 TaxID=2563100 RepID=UPI0010A2050E|nr:RNA-guided endonuclease TnpB family protein [Streptomyces sp. A0642]THA70522.1 transposase [Streptomyces sp. A0642]